MTTAQREFGIYVQCICLFLGLQLMTACAPTTVPPAASLAPAAVGTDEFVVVEIKDGDTFASLADTYLNDSSRGWVIEEFNGVNTLTPGKMLVIPRIPLKRGGLAPTGQQTVPVLVYHNFSETKVDKTTVNRARFAEQMKYLRDNDYTVIPLQELMDFFQFKIDLPERSVVLTIDDGWCGTHEVAYPILKEYGYPATLFLNTDMIHDRKCLSWEQVKEMAADGIDIQNHTRTHANANASGNGLSLKDYIENLDSEIATSHALIKNKLQHAPVYMAHPYGETNNLFTTLLKRHGYQGAFTVQRAGNPFDTDPYAVNRSVISGEYDLDAFRENLTIFEKGNLQ